MKKTVAIILALILPIIALSAYAESSVDEVTVLFEKCVNYILYKIFSENENVSIDKIEAYTLPSGFDEICVYYKENIMEYGSGRLTEDMPYIRVYFSTKNKFGAVSTIDSIYKIYGGFE